MKLSWYFLATLLLLITILMAGCTTKGPLQIPGSNATKTISSPTPTAIPTPTYGSLFVGSNPLGASVYLEDKYQGVAPLNITNIPNGRYNLTLKLERYTTVRQIVDIRGQATTLSIGMSEASPKIDISVMNASVLNIPPCIWSFIGNLNNTGELKVYNVKTTLTMTPARTGYKTIQKFSELGDIAAGVSRPFSFEVTVLCEGNYRAEIRWDGIDIKNPNIITDDTKISGSKTI